MASKQFTSAVAASDSLVRRASQKEVALANDKQLNKSLSSPPNSGEAKNVRNFFSVAFRRFQTEFASLYPEIPLPFEELDSLDQARVYLKSQQDRLASLSKELNRTKFLVKFLEEIISHKDYEKANKEDDLNGDSSGNKEQYVTVITLNDSTYGEIKKSKASPKQAGKPAAEEIEESLIEAKVTELSKCTPPGSEVGQKTEPIYLNTLETKKPAEKASKKRPPTPPRKPKFNKLPGSSNDIFTSVTSATTTTIAASLPKSDSYAAIPQIQPQQRKFNGPMQQVSLVENSEKDNEENSPETKARTNSKTNFMRTFSLDQKPSNGKIDGKKVVDKLNTDSKLFKDYDNIYDTVAPDSDCDITDDKSHSMKDDDIETSSHEMLSRSSSTDEGLSNYVNIDYFLRKNSLSRSNSNLPGRKFSTDEVDNEDNETNMSSIRSSDYDNFSSSENLLNSFQPQTSNSLQSFNSSSTSSNSGSSLRERIKMPNSEFANTYPPNMSTFTPPIRETNSFVFFKDTPSSDPETSLYCNSADLNISKSSNNTSLENNPGSKAEYYAYTDILDSLPSKPDTSDEPVALENKSFESKVDQEEEEEIVDPEMEHCQEMHYKIVKSIIESETLYLDCLKTLVQYKKALSTSTSSKESIISAEDLDCIFFRIPELFQVHETFLNGLKIVEQGHKLKSTDSAFATNLLTKHSVGELFYNLAKSLPIYSDFLQNYSIALDTANRCSANNAKFSGIIKSIKIASLHGQFTNLIELLHKPIARLQKNALVLHDLLKYSDCCKEDERKMLQDALKLTQNFLNDLNLDAARKLFTTPDKFKRRLVKESFIIENAERRKLRHLFLFNDVIVCTKYKPSSKQKFTFELKWFQMLNDIVLDIPADLQSMPTYSSANNSSQTLPFNSSSNILYNAHLKELKEGSQLLNQINGITSRVSALRCDLFIEEKRKRNRKVVEKLTKKLHELEAELVLCLPHLKFSFHVKNNPNKSYTFFLSSEYDRNCWIETIRRMHQSASSNTESASIYELQRWVESCRKSINPNLGSFLLRSQKDENLRNGDLNLRINHLHNFQNDSNLFIAVETDSYGHFFKRITTKFVTNDQYANVNEEFLLELDGTQTLRFLLYKSVTHTSNDVDSGEGKTENVLMFKGKACLELTSSCVSKEYRPKNIQLFQHTLSIEMSFVSMNAMMEKIPPNKIYGSFGVNISQVCKKEKSKIPYLIMSCITEVERRGIKEVGIYRVSGLSSDVQRLKKAFETNPREVFWLIRDIDIHAVTGVLKLYLRELPESLFTNDMYQQYFEARDLKNADEKDMKMTSLLSQLIEPNQSTVIFLIDHLVYVNRYEEQNKMSLNNLATIFGPTMLRTNSSSGNNPKNSSSMSGSSGNAGSAVGVNSNLSSNMASLVINTDLFTASTIDVMAQADILYFFLRRKSEGFSLTSIDREETCL